MQEYAFIRNRGAIIFITCAIVSLVPIFLASALVVYANTFSVSALPGLLSLGAFMIYMTPVCIFGMGDFIFYKTVVGNQDIAEHEKWESIVAFFLAFVVLYVFYFFSLDLVNFFVQTLKHGI